MFTSKETKILIDDIVENNEKWKQTKHYFMNKETKHAIWTANGILSIDFYPEISAFNIFEKIAIHRAIKICNILNATNFKKGLSNG